MYLAYIHFKKEGRVRETPNTEDYKSTPPPPPLRYSTIIVSQIIYTFIICRIQHLYKTTWPAISSYTVYTMQHYCPNNMVTRTITGTATENSQYSLP